MPDLITRRAWLATAVQAEAAPVTTHRAAQLLAGSPWASAGRNTARKDLRALCSRGLLLAHDADNGRRTYTTPERSAA
ncbi:hypothetical protein AB0I93_14450 [Streptomyces sp. NPDC049967]|uniref:hypothetical protein n=1 Tax=Streptomyces sp. NPDC049967 TaxID=3155658 RepID=UPI003416224E